MQTPAAVSRTGGAHRGGFGAWRRAAQPWLAWLGVSLAFGWLLAIVWWAVLSPSVREDITDELVIPQGTAAALRAGEATAFIPATVSLRPGSRLLVVNNDIEEHLVGNAVIPPGATAELTAPPDGEGFYCTIHPSGFLGVHLKERAHFLTTMLPALVIGIPLGLMAGAASWVGRRGSDKSTAEDAEIRIG